MAIDLGSVTLVLKERTTRIEVLTPLGVDPTIRAWREKVWLDGSGAVVKRESDVAVVERRLSTVAGQTIGSVTGAVLAGLIALAADTFRQEDLA